MRRAPAQARRAETELLAPGVDRRHGVGRRPAATFRTSKRAAAQQKVSQADAKYQDQPKGQQRCDRRGGMAGRKLVVYHAWNRPGEAGAPLEVIENRFPTLFEIRRMRLP